MDIGRISSSSGGLLNSMISRVMGGGGGASEAIRKSFGEPLPQVVDISNNPELQALFTRQSMVERIRRKLSTLSRKKGRIVPAKGIIASVLQASEVTHNQDLVFVGVDFLSEYQTQEETVAGVLAHEWGHLVSDLTQGINPDQLTWEQVFQLRKEEEAMADGFAGKMLCLMEHTPNGLIQFLGSGTGCHKESHKYHSLATRAAIIRAVYQDTQRRQNQAKNMMIFSNSPFSNPFTTQLIAVA